MMPSKKCTVRHSFVFAIPRVDLSHLDGHYLNIPVVEADGRLLAIVDVLTLTYATLEQVDVSPLSFIL
jgi:hypothetical protein